MVQVPSESEMTTETTSPVVSEAGKPVPVRVRVSPPIGLRVVGLMAVKSIGWVCWPPRYVTGIKPSAVWAFRVIGPVTRGEAISHWIWLPVLEVMAQSMLFTLKERKVSGALVASITNVSLSYCWKLVMAMVDVVYV